MTVNHRYSSLLAVVVSLCCFSGCGETAYDLTFTVEPGDVYRMKSLFARENSELQISQGRESVVGSQTVYQRETLEFDIFAADDGQPSSMKVSFLESWQRDKTQINGGEPEITQESSPLQARSLLYRKSGNTWKTVLVGGEPTPEQTAAIETQINPWPVDFVPDHAISVGDSWVVTGAALSHIAGTESKTTEGELKAYFEQVIERDGILCAMISIHVDMTGTVPAETGQTVTITLSGEGHVYRSIAEKIDIVSSLSGTMTLQAVQVVPGESDLIMITKGPFSIYETMSKDSF